MSQATLEAELKQRIQDWLRSFAPDAPIVVVPVFNAYDDVLACVKSLLETTRAGTPILVLDDASSDDRIRRDLEPLVAYARKPANDGFVRTVNCAFEWSAPRDVVVVNSDVIMPAGWLERLQAAAYFRSNVATATPLTNSGTLVSVPYRNQPVPDLPPGMTLAQVDGRIRDTSMRLRPILPTAVGHCTYFRRTALDTIGYFDEGFSPGYGEEVDFSQRAVMAGFCHVAADDVFVFHKGSRSFGQASEARQRLLEAHNAVIFRRYPWYLAWVIEAAHDLYSPLAQAIESASAALLGYRIAVDATCLNGSTTGTQVITLELIRALAAAPNRHGRLTVIIGDGASPADRVGIDRLVDDVIRVSQLKQQDDPLFDLIHRPFQATSAGDVKLLRTAARRFIVSHLDSIAYANPVYALTADAWKNYRRQTEYVFATADGIAFISHDAARDAAHQGLHIPSERAGVTYVGVDHHLHAAAAATPPIRFEAWDDQPFLLVIGTDFKHKNRAHAIRLFKALVEKRDWPGWLVLAGPHVSSGGSIEEEAQARSSAVVLQHRIHDIGAVSEAEKTWLLQHAALVLYPSVYEGFGIVPFEAAAAGTPALTARSTSLIEVLGDDLLYLDTFHPDTGAETVWALLSDPACARRQVDAIRARAARFTWGAVAVATWEFYRKILNMPPRLQGVAGYLRGIDDAGKPANNGGQSVRDWNRRVALGFRVFRTGGWRALRKEIRQYIQWRRAQY